MSKRMTVQRHKILNYLKQVKTHPTAEMVYTGLKKDLPSMTLATVYRNLNCLAEQGDIQKIEVNNTSHFDGDISFHQHCICTSCNRIFDVHLQKLGIKNLAKLGTISFKPDTINILIYGTCKNCKGGKAK